MTLVDVPLNPHGLQIPVDRLDQDLSYYDRPTDPEAFVRGDVGAWQAEWVLEKHQAPSADVRSGLSVPTEVIHRKGNLLTYGGVDVLMLGLKAGLSATTGLKNTYFDNSNAVIYVGDSTAAVAASQTDLQATSESTNRDAVGMEATYPTHTTGDSATGNQDITFRSVFDTNTANFAWQEWAVGNTTKTTAPYPGRILNRKIESLGTKTAAGTWTFTVKISIA